MISFLDEHLKEWIDINLQELKDDNEEKACNRMRNSKNKHNKETMPDWCNRFVRAWGQDMPRCPNCDSGFVEEIRHSNRSEGRRRGFPAAAAAMYMLGHRSSSHQNPRSSNRRHCRTAAGDGSQFTPVIMLPGEGSSRDRGFELFYNAGAGAGLRQLPQRMSEFILGSGFDRMMENLSHVDANGGAGRHDRSNSPASKTAVESLAEIVINETHMATESHCAVCKERFELGTLVREIPCKHIYHSECILPWLAIRNSCPVCRYELPSEAGRERVNEEEGAGLTIWRLPGGGYAVGRRGIGEREFPLVYTEVDGGFNNIIGEPRRVSWSVSSSSGRGSGGAFRRMVNGLFGCLRGGVRPQSSVSSIITTREIPQRSTSNRSGNSASRPNLDPSSRSRRTWSMDVNSGNRPW
ncbi:hypothetical protein RJT34_11591 [Clitoria ternatea]|uniref:RING-type E3 ubiquitin transferase n=1 Tax=Clitoria ternatea TaxID=43366 RepID=A0AAN9JMT4_CLITE